MTETVTARLRADFNGLFGDLLCLSHRDVGVDESGKEVILEPGMTVTAFDPDEDEHGGPGFLVATGTVVPSPDWLSCSGSKWALQINETGVKNQSHI
jgi:hypothetical protein